MVLARRVRSCLEQSLDDLVGIVDMALHAHCQGFDTLQQVERIGWAHAGAEVAQAFGPGPC